ncbi:MAG: hypothetical protein APR53_07520 [Methanoculleus sp. SDB]|nr:MAG: hypothetical protein APR53_07520 [Methanoculleus sp. SDB]
MEKNKIIVIGGAVVVIIAIAAVLAGMGDFSRNIGSGPVQNGGQEPGAVQPGGLNGGPGAGTMPALLPREDPSPLSEQEIEDILFMREEEQLAHDLYTRWAGMYTLPIFANIADSETMHIYEVQLLIDRYGLPSDRIGNSATGYHSPVIQSLYDEFGPQGEISLTDALELGLAVEERDIADLDMAIANTTRTDVLQVWYNLRQGSEAHKSAFLRALGR